MKDEVLRLALEGFENIRHHFDTDEYAYEVAVKSITAIKQALEETQGVSPESEPVCYLWVDPKTQNYIVDRCDHPLNELIPVYTSPPKREWQGLTDDEQQELYDAWIKIGDGWGTFYALIEAKLKERNT